MSAHHKLGLLAWIRSFPSAVAMLLRGAAVRSAERVGSPVMMSDGRCYVPFRHTTLTTSRATSAAAHVVVHVRFELGAVGRPGSMRHRMFRRLCIVTTPFFVGLPGFRSKLWMYDPRTGGYAGLYDWDDLHDAVAYADGLGKILRLVSKAGSVSCEITGGVDVATYLERALARPETKVS